MELMLAFIHPAHSMMALASESVPARPGVHSFPELMRHTPDSVDLVLAFTHPAHWMMTLVSESVPARPGVHSFPELMRHTLPDSMDHMLASTPYPIMALLGESVPL